MDAQSLPTSPSDRSTEWFVPRFGPARFRYAVGLLFLPYTGMVLAYAALGAVLAPRLHGDRLAAIVVIYALGLGVAAHALDALGSRGRKPWGRAFSRCQLWGWALGSLAGAYGLAAVYVFGPAPWLWTVAVLEGFFVFAYNLEWLGGRFHTDGWFAFSWGFLPVQAGYLIQANRLSAAALVAGVAAALLSLVEIRASRPYKELRQRAGSLGPEELARARRFEGILRALSLGVICLGVALVLARWQRP